MRREKSSCWQRAVREMRKGFSKESFRRFEQKAKLSSFYVGRQTCSSRRSYRHSWRSDWMTGADKERPDVVMYDVEIAWQRDVTSDLKSFCSSKRSPMIDPVLEPFQFPGQKSVADEEREVADGRPLQSR